MSDSFGQVSVKLMLNKVYYYPSSLRSLWTPGLRNQISLMLGLDLGTHVAARNCLGMLV